MQHLIERGEKIENKWKGLTSLHEAILYCNNRYIKTLISAGASLEAKINKPQSKINDMNVIELARFIDGNESLSENTCETLEIITKANET